MNIVWLWSDTNRSYEARMRGMTCYVAAGYADETAAHLALVPIVPHPLAPRKQEKTEHAAALRMMQNTHETRCKPLEFGVK